MGLYTLFENCEYSYIVYHKYIGVVKNKVLKKDTFTFIFSIDIIVQIVYIKGVKRHKGD